MSTNSLHFKGQQNGTSPTEQGFQCDCINSKNPQREKDFAYTKYQQRYLEIFFCLFLMSSFTQLFAQSGASCATSKNLGIGASYSGSQTFNMPSGELWMKFINPANAARITMTPDTNGGSNSLKFKEIYVYLDSCGGKQLFYSSFDTTQVVSFNYLLTQIPVYSNVYIYAKRYIKAGCGGCDTAYKSFSVSLSSNNNLMGGLACNSNLCPNNLILNGDFEEYTSLVSFNNDWVNNICGWSNVNNKAEYYNSDNSGGFTDIPSLYTGSPGISTDCHIIQPPSGTSNLWYNGNTNNAMAGLSMDYSQYDVLQGSLSEDLIDTRQYYVSFNAVNSGADNYAGDFMINFTDQAYTPNNGADFTGYTDVPITCSGTPPTSYGQWQSYSTVFTANGGENIFHIGNIDNVPNTNALSQTIITQGSLPEYLFVDNFVLTPLAFAGNDVSLCPGATAELGGCGIPDDSVSYAWSPTTGLSCSTCPNPTVTGTGSNITYTVYVTYILNGVTYTASDLVDVLNGGITVTLGASPLVLTSAGTTVITAMPSGAGIYDFYYLSTPGTILQSSTSNNYTTISLSSTTSYGVTLTDTNGCSAQTSIEILYTTTPCDGTSPLTHITSNSTSQLASGTYSGVAFDVTNGFTFNSDVSFNNCEFWIRDGATVNINSSTIVTMMNSLVRQCDKMWNRINNRGGFKAVNTTFTQGDRAVVMKNGSNNVFDHCWFNDNVYGISSADSSTVQTVSLDVTGTTFRHLNGFVTGYTGQTQFHALPAAGIQLRDLSDQTIGDDNEDSNLFTDQYFGIINERTNLTVNNSYFDNFSILNQSGTPPAPNSGNALPYRYSGVALYAHQGTTGAFLTTLNGAPGQDYGANATIRNALYKGILVFNMAADILNVNITDCSVGIDFENLMANFDSRVLNCSLDVAYTGIFLYGSATTSSILAQENFIEINPISGGNGLSGIRLDNQNGTNNDASIRLISNKIESFGSNNGIYLQNCSGGGTYVSCNTIIKDFDGAFRGIQVKNAGESTIKTNNVTATNVYTAGSGNNYNTNVGIDVTTSPNLRLSCNITNNQFIGIMFSGNNAGSGAGLSGNEMGTHRWGLYYAPTATVGHCDHRGNTWVQAAPSGGFHARNDNFAQPFPCVTNSTTQYLINRITTGTPNGSSTNVTTSIPTGSPNVANPCTTGVVGLNNSAWFTSQPLIADYDSCGLEHDSCDLWVSMRSSQNIEEMEMLAQAENLATDFNAETSYMVKQSLYEFLDENPDNLEESEVLDSLYTELQNSSTGKNTYIKALIQQGSPDYLMDELKTNIINLKDAAQILAYTIKSKGNVTNAKHNYSYYLNENQELNAEIKTLKASKRVLANLNNNAIDPENIVSYNTKVITGIYLSEIYGVDSVDLNSSLTTLASIANQCPLIGGPAVYWARGIYEMVVSGVVYDDDSVCAIISNERRGVNPNLNLVIANKTLASDERIRTYPNPTDGTYTIEVETSNLNAIAQIYDVLGKVVFEQKITTKISTLDLSNLNKGTYIVSILNETGNIYRSKVSIN